VSLHETRIDGRIEFIMRCDKCGYETDSVQNKLDYMAQKFTCPHCGENVDMTLGEPRPESGE
jgi:predicted RNA-binding Zn-ribbon protein involved in translation (DUF1610 family)